MTLPQAVTAALKSIKIASIVEEARILLDGSVPSEEDLTELVEALLDKVAAFERHPALEAMTDEMAGLVAPRIARFVVRRVREALTPNGGARGVSPMERALALGASSRARVVEIEAGTGAPA